MIICSRCKTENDETSKFCRQCGNDLTINVDAPANEDLKALAYALNEQAVSTKKQPFNLNKAISDIPKKIGNGIKKTGGFLMGLLRKTGKKRLMIISVSIATIIACVIFSINYVIPFAPHYFKANSALNAADYVTAISEYELAENFFDAKSKLNDAHYLYAEELYKDENFYDSALQYKKVKGYADTKDKLVECGTELLENKEYKDALKVFDMVKTDKVDKLKNYASAMESFNDKEYEKAKKGFKAAEGYNNSEELINACDFLIAEEHLKNSKFEQAKTIYVNLPEGFTYNGISSTDRITLLNNSQDLLNAMGRWTVSDYCVESRDVYVISGSSNSWTWTPDTSDLTDQMLELSCKINSNGAFDINVEVSFYKCDYYSYLSDDYPSEITHEFFTISDVTSIPASYMIDDYTTLNYSDGVFSISYFERDNSTTYLYSVYSSSVTYGNR